MKTQPSNSAKTTAGPSASPKTAVTVQPKLSLNMPGDRWEQEADRAAEEVLRPQNPGVLPAPALPLALSPLPAVQRRENPGESAGPNFAPPSVLETLSSGGGRPLEPETEEFMGSRFGRDFSQVRIHDGGRAAESAAEIGARAYASGRDIVFGNGEYRPETAEGRRLLAHELAHTVQQSGGGLVDIVQREETDFPEIWEMRGIEQVGGSGRRAIHADGLALEIDIEVESGFNVRLAANTLIQGLIRERLGESFELTGDNYRSALRDLLEVFGGPNLESADIPMMEARGLRFIRYRFDMSERQFLERYQSLAIRDFVNSQFEAASEVPEQGPDPKIAFIRNFEGAAHRLFRLTLENALTRLGELEQTYLDGQSADRERLNLAVTARGISDRDREVRELSRRRSELLEPSEDMRHRPIITDPTEHRRLGREIERVQTETIRQARRESEILRAFANYSDLQQAAGELGEADAGQARRLRSLFREKREAIERLQGEAVNIWLIPRLVALTKENTGVQPGTLEEYWVDGYVNSTMWAQTSLRLFITGFEVALGLLATAATGGTALLLAGAAFSLGAADLYQDLETYEVESDLANYSIDTEEGLAEPPSQFWLAVSFFGLFFDVADVVQAAARIGRPVRAALRASETVLDEARQAQLLEEVRQRATQKFTGLQAAGKIRDSVSQTDFVNAAEAAARQDLRYPLLIRPVSGPTAGLSRVFASRLRETGQNLRQYWASLRGISNLPGETIIEMGQDLADAERIYIGLIEETSAREAAIWRNAQTGEYVVVQGDGDWVIGSVSGPGGSERWLIVEHYHPERNPFVQYPSEADYRALLHSHGGAGAITGRVQSTIRYRDPLTGTYHYSVFGYDPSLAGHPIGPYYLNVELENGVRMDHSFSDYSELSRHMQHEELRAQSGGILASPAPVHGTGPSSVSGAPGEGGLASASPEIDGTDVDEAIDRLVRQGDDAASLGQIAPSLGRSFISTLDLENVVAQGIRNLRSRLGRQWLRPNHFGTLLHSEIESIFSTRFASPPAGWTVLAEQRLDAFSSMVTAQTRDMSIRDFIQTHPTLNAYSDELALAFRSLDSRVGDKIPDLVITGPGQIVVWDLTARSVPEHLAKTLFYAEVLGGEGSRLVHIGETYWRYF